MTVEDALLAVGRLLTRRPTTADGRAQIRRGGREGDVFYRDRWAHDKVVRSTHGVNCTGSCSWQVYVKDGIITWETQATDYPDVGPDSPQYEPRGCPRGAAFSWYTYAPTRVRFPYVRGVLLEAYRAAKQRHGGDPVLAFAEVSTDLTTRRRYQRARGKGGLVRVGWAEAIELAAAAHVHTIRVYGPDRVAGFSPIPAMSMVSHAAGSRFIELLGGVMTSFYDWYADLPVASPQVFGDQTDVPESGDWWNAAYLMLWGSNVPVTRTPDAHWMAEVRYRGTKVVVVSPDFADATKFADAWLPAQPGTDGALAMAMGHVILQESFVDRQVPSFVDYVRRFTDLPFLVTLDPTDGGYLPGKFLTEAGLSGRTTEGSDAPADGAAGAAAWRTVLWDTVTGGPAAPNGSLGFRYGADGAGRWNLDLGDIEPALSMMDSGAPDAGGTDEVEAVTVLLPRFDEPGVLRRGVPARRIGDRLVTTVFDLMLAQYGVLRPGLPGDWPAGYDDPVPGTPAWQEPITSVPAEAAVRIAREFAGTAERSGGRCMIIMGAGVCQWFHGDAAYRAILALPMLTGCLGRNGGGWAHYVGQEKIRPLAGWQTLASGADWIRPARQAIGTGFWYQHTSQWRYDPFPLGTLASPVGPKRLADLRTADALALATRLGWMPASPQFDRNPLDLADEACDAAAAKRKQEAGQRDPACDAAAAKRKQEAGQRESAGDDPGAYIAEKLRTGELRFAADDPDNPVNWPRVLTVWRSNLLGSSAKGNEYFLRHLLGTGNDNLTARPASPRDRPREVSWPEEIPEGKLDLLICADFRMTSSTLLADVVFPAATWYEKHDLSSTDMHPFVHAFNPAIDPPWQARTDYRLFSDLATEFSRLAEKHLGVRRDLVATPLTHDTIGETGDPGGVTPDWRATGATPVPGQTMPHITVVERDYPGLADRWHALGPLVEEHGVPVKGVLLRPDREVRDLAGRNGVMLGGAAEGRPALDTAAKMAEAVLALSGTTNGRLAVQGFRDLEARVGRPLADLAEGEADRRITFAETQGGPVPTLTSPEWSGIERGGRRYSPFTINVERLAPWHTLTGRMHFFLDHDWMAEFGEQLPVYRPPLDLHRLFGEPRLGVDGAAVTVRYLTPHSKWSIHSEYQDNLLMLALSRGGPTIWLSVPDAGAIGVGDNDWVEAVNRNGVLVARAIVSHRMPPGTAFVYHVQERTIDVPKSEATGRRGGIHNSLTRVLIKPTHLIGGYAQLSFAFNYFGPTGNQRDEVTVVRRRGQEVTY